MIETPMKGPTVIGYLIVGINCMLIGIVMGITVHSNRVKHQQKMNDIYANDPLRPRF